MQIRHRGTLLVFNWRSRSTTFVFRLCINVFGLELKHITILTLCKYEIIKLKLTIRITWLSTVQTDLRCHNLTLPEEVDMAQTCPLWRMLSIYGTTQSWVAWQQWWRWYTNIAKIDKLDQFRTRGAI